MKPIKTILDGQKLQIDNHHNNSELNWNDTLHFHKYMTVKKNGETADISGVFYLKNDKVDVQYKNHHPITNDKKKIIYIDELKNEITDALKNKESACKFFKNIKKKLSETFPSINEEEETARLLESFDNVMKALNINTKLRYVQENANGLVLCLYFDGNEVQIEDEILKRVKEFDECQNEDEYETNYRNSNNASTKRIYAISSKKRSDSIEIGEFVRSLYSQYKKDGFDFTKDNRKINN